MGFVTFASFDDTLSISHKKSIDKSFFSPEISLRTAVTFFMVRSVTQQSEHGSYGLPFFLVADTRLYTLPCRSVRRSVRRSVGPSVRPSRIFLIGQKRAKMSKNEISDN